MKSDTASILSQFDPIDQKYQELDSKKRYDDFSDIKSDDGSECLMLWLSCIDRIAGSESGYAKLARNGLDRQGRYWAPTIPETYGIVKALKRDVGSSYLTSLRELVHADLFSDFLETAEYFLGEGHKDPAAVMIGGVLEEHLRQLCRKNGIDTEAPDAKVPTKAVPKKADTLNADLAKASVYSKLELKQVTAWLDIRNNAAHSKYNAYNHAQVELFVQGVRDLVARFPA